MKRTPGWCVLTVNDSLQTAWPGRIMSESPATASSEFPQSIGRVARRELALHGFTRFEHLTRASARDLLKIHGVGPKAVRILEEELRAQGRAFLDRSGAA